MEVKSCGTRGVKMSLLTRLGSMTLKSELSYDGDKDTDSIALAAQRRTAVLLFLGWFVVAWLGFHLGNRDAAISTNTMLGTGLLSEWYPPRRLHESLFQSRELSISKGGENATCLRDLWNAPDSQGWKPCVKSIEIPEEAAKTLRILSGMMQHSPIMDITKSSARIVNAVAVAKMLNATLVLPYFTDSGVWNDTSKFHDIYDIDHFIFSLKNYVPVVRDLPVDLEWSTPEYYDRCDQRPTCISYIPKHSNEDWYMVNVLPVMQRYGIVATRKYHHKLTFDDLPEEAVKIRCLTNFYALKFVPSLIELSGTLVERLREKAKEVRNREVSSKSPVIEPSKNSRKKSKGGGSSRHLTADRGSKVPFKSPEKFIGLHLRFEKDMIAHSACYYDGGIAERRALAAYRKFLFQNRAEKAAFPSWYLRMNGSCPLSPEEAGLLLAGLGYDNNSVIYIAGQTVYGGEARLKPLRDLFPYLEMKETIATEEELRPLKRHGLQLAALDFLVLLESDVYMSTAAGNFPNVQTGYRTFYGGKKSIHPDKATLAKLLTANSSVSWDEFSEQVRLAHTHRLGAPKMRPPKYSVYRYPIPDCMCRDDDAE